jgi:hypothetical protein
VFESTEKLAEQITRLLEGLRASCGGRYACILDPQRIRFETPEPEEAEDWALRRLLEERTGALFRIPESLAAGGPAEDVFEGWSGDELFLAFINGRVALVIACPDAEPLREQAMKPLRVLADRLFRYEPRYRMDRRGRGFFFGRAKLDIVVVGRPEG